MSAFAEDAIRRCYRAGLVTSEQCAVHVDARGHALVALIVCCVVVSGAIGKALRIHQLDNLFAFH